MSETRPFWMVWSEEESRPIKILPDVCHYPCHYPTECAAVDAAELLAAAYPGKRFIVLQTVCAIQANKVVNIDLRPD